MLLLAKLKRDTFALQARHLHHLLNSVQCLIDTPETPFPLRLMLMIKDVIKARASASLPKHPTRTTSPEGFLKIVFHNKGVEKIGLSGILNQKLVLETVPPFIRLPGPVEKMYLLLYLVSGKMLYLRKLMIGSLSCLNCIPNPQ